MGSDYLAYWQQHGLDTITPRGLDNPEGFDVGEVLGKVFEPGQSVLEIGCGIGRIARHFDPALYIGVDINPSAVDAARQRLPAHDFRLIGLNDDLPASDAALLYTVCLHVPDNRIDTLLARAAFGRQRVVIAEIMNKAYRAGRDDGACYDISNHRTIEEYEAIMGRVDMKLDKALQRDYAYYPGERITIGVFTR